MVSRSGLDFDVDFDVGFGFDFDFWFEVYTMYYIDCIYYMLYM